MAHLGQQQDSAESSSSLQDADDLWQTYLEAADKERRRLVDHTSTTMNGVLTFVCAASLVPSPLTDDVQQAGLFAATVAAFLVDSQKSLKPDAGAQARVLLAIYASADTLQRSIPCANEDDAGESMGGIAKCARSIR